METRDILDFNGNIIGEISFPDNTPEIVWKGALSAYLQPPTSPLDMVQQRITSAQDFGASLITEIAAENVLLGITTQQVTQLLAQNAVLIAALQTGSLYTAIQLIQQLPPDNLFITPDRVSRYVSMLQTYLGVALTGAASK